MASLAVSGGSGVAGSGVPEAIEAHGAQGREAPSVLPLQRLQRAFCRTWGGLGLIGVDMV